MSFLRALKSLFSPASGLSAASGAASGDPYGLWLHFRCNRCGSVVRIRADRRNDFNRVDADESPAGSPALLLVKDVMDNKCFQLIHAEVCVDATYKTIGADVHGGQLITQEEYEDSLETQAGT